MSKWDFSEIRTLYDVQQILKMFNIYVYVGKRIWDIEMMALELDNLYNMHVISKDVWLRSKLVLQREHRLEEDRSKGEL